MSDAPPIDASRAVFARHALLPSGWAQDVLMQWDAQGSLTLVRPNASAPERVQHIGRPLLPGQPNLHSHAFQRVFAGLTEHRGSAADSFWSWREQMYRVALAVSPEQLEHIATQLYVEMLCAGYTSVCEFHYLHHDPAGQPYADPAEMSLRLMAAAQRAGIGLTLLPVLYQHGGFGARPAQPQQRRFIDSVDGLLGIVERLRAAGARIGARMGVAPHSLRAVSPQALMDLLESVHSLDATAPVHIHIAEQTQEVDDCLAWSGRRPVQWLLDRAQLDARWCLVHATHMTADETAAVAASGATVGLCPSTEANLGDGVFDAVGLRAHAGAWGIGSDSHASVDVFEELRLFEYTQRLATRSRNVLADIDRPDVAEAMWRAAAQGGARASGLPIGTLAVGRRADFIVLDDHADLAGLNPAQVLASLMFAPRARRAICETWVAGRRVVQEGGHPLADSACEAFVSARRELLDRA